VLTVSWELALRADGYAHNTLGVKAARALDPYLRERRRHQYADASRLWLGSRGRPTLAADGVDAMLKHRGADAGISDLHPHAFRHTWAHAFRRPEEMSLHYSRQSRTTRA